jgi:hypothetical protein
MKEQTPRPTAELLRDTVLDEAALYFVSYDGLVNNNAFQRHGVLTYQGYQYAAWYGADRRAVIARRPKDGEAWERVALPHELTVDDSHNVICIGISPQDNRLHVLMDSHSSEFYYTRSALGPTLSFAPISTTLGTLPLTSQFTYPQFAVSPSGRLQLLYRAGISGDGCAALAEYDDGVWTDLGAWSSNTGTYTNANGSSDARNLYVHGIDYGPDGRLHVFGTWREQNRAVLTGGAAYTGGITNHDIVYVYSLDEARTWHNTAGDLVSRTGATTPLVAIHSPVVVAPLSPDHALMNQESQTTDSRGRPHALVSYVPNAPATDYVADRVRDGRVHHLYQDSSGNWQLTEIPVPLRSTQRSQLLFDCHDNAYALLPYGRIAAASATSAWTDWTTLFDGTQSLDAFGEVVPDHTRVAQDGVLSFMYQRKSAGTIPSALHMIDFRLPGRPGGRSGR